MFNSKLKQKVKDLEAELELQAHINDLIMEHLGVDLAFCDCCDELCLREV
jgi:hypothetical protein